MLELTPTLQLAGDFAPSRWAYDNAHDLDLGSVAPTLLPDGFIFIAGKSGIGYVLRASSLGGVGGQVYSAQVCGGALSFGDTAFSGDTLYQPCSNGTEAISVSSTGSFSILWQTPSGSNGPPVLDGGSLVTVDWHNGTLYVLNPGNGSIEAQIGVGSVPDFTSPALLGDLALVGTAFRGGGHLRALSRDRASGERPAAGRRTDPYTGRRVTGLIVIIVLAVGFVALMLVEPPPPPHPAAGQEPLPRPHLPRRPRPAGEAPAPPVRGAT